MLVDFVCLALRGKSFYIMAGKSWGAMGCSPHVGTPAYPLACQPLFQCRQKRRLIDSVPGDARNSAHFENPEFSKHTISRTNCLRRRIIGPSRALVGLDGIKDGPGIPSVAPQ
jgi:hypothetical protein